MRGTEVRPAVSEEDVVRACPGSFAGAVDANLPQFGMGGRLRPRDFAGDAEHRRDGVIPKGDDRVRMLAARAGNIDDAVNEGIGRGLSSHPGTSEPQVRVRRSAGSSGKENGLHYSGFAAGRVAEHATTAQSNECWGADGVSNRSVPAEVAAEDALPQHFRAQQRRVAARDALRRPERVAAVDHEARFARDASVKLTAPVAFAPEDGDIPGVHGECGQYSSSVFEAGFADRRRERAEDDSCRLKRHAHF